MQSSGDIHFFSRSVLFVLFKRKRVVDSCFIYTGTIH